MSRSRSNSVRVFKFIMYEIDRKQVVSRVHCTTKPMSKQKFHKKVALWLRQYDCHAYEIVSKGDK